jgi:hypothetical protein
MPETKQFILIKTTPKNLLFTLRSVVNPQLTRKIFLTKQHPQQPLPAEWALSVVADQKLFAMFKKGYFTFDKPDELAALAYEKGYWFGEKFDFKPASKDDEKLILAVLKVGNRDKIQEAIKQYGKSRVRDIAADNVGVLSQNVIQLLEKLFGVQLVVDNDDAEYSDAE